MDVGKRIFISYRSKEPDLGLARDFYGALQAAGHFPFMAAENITLGEDWPKRIDAELAASDYLLLLLSDKAATSEMVIEEVRRARELRHEQDKPKILPIQVNLTVQLNYQLRSYLQSIQQGAWQGPADTPQLTAQVLKVIGQGTTLEPSPLVASGLPLVEDGTMPPLPVAEPEFPTGEMVITSPFYIERSSMEQRCYSEVEKASALIRIKAPRQMGKTSLLARILDHAKKKDYATAYFSFQSLDKSAFSSSDAFLRRFCGGLGRRLGVAKGKLDELWLDDSYGLIEKCSEYLESYVMPECDGPLLIGLDEVDRVFPYQTISEDFFPMLRFWNEQTKNDTSWKKLRLVVVHSTEVYIKLETNSSPFENVGIPIDLGDFTVKQVQKLAELHGLRWGAGEIAQLQAVVGGHPYLVRLALYYLVQKELTMAELLQQAATERGLFKDHLRQHLWNLEQHPDLLQAMKKVVAVSNPVRQDTVQAFKLQGMGLVDVVDYNVQPRYELYRRYFRERLRGV